MRIPALVLAFALVTAGTTAAAQAADTVDAAGGVRQAWTFGAWGGLARNSPSTIWGTAAGYDVAVAGLRAARSILRTRLVAADYTLDVVPGAWVLRPPELPPSTCLAQSRHWWLCEANAKYVQRPPAYGVGAAPFGLQLRFRPASTIQPFVAASAGILWFQEPIPNERASGRNFTLDAGGGLLIMASERLGALAGYKLYHISNGGTAESNPGIDSHMVYVGLVRLR